MSQIRATENWGSRLKGQQIFGFHKGKFLAYSCMKQTSDLLNWLANTVLFPAPVIFTGLCFFWSEFVFVYCCVRHLNRNSCGIGEKGFGYVT